MKLNPRVKSFTVAHRKYDVRFMNKVDKSDSFNGMIDHTKFTVKIKKQFDNEELETLIHEMVHAALSVSGRPEREDEPLVHVLGALLTQALLTAE